MLSVCLLVTDWDSKHERYQQVLPTQPELPKHRKLSRMQGSGYQEVQDSATGHSHSGKVMDW